MVVLPDQRDVVVACCVFSDIMPSSREDQQHVLESLQAFYTSGMCPGESVLKAKVDHLYNVFITVRAPRT